MRASDTSASRLRRLGASVLFCALLFAVLAYASAVLKPTRGGKDAGAAWDAYLAQPRDTIDAVFFGNSHVFDSVDPASIWRDGGIPTFVNGGPTMTVRIMKRYVRESLRTQRPSVVVLEMSDAAYEPDKFDRTYHLINVGYMPWGAEKVSAILFDTPDGERTAVALDLWTYHSRWDQVRPSDFAVWSKRDATPYLKGFLPKPGSKVVTSAPAVETAEDTRFAVTRARQHLADYEAIAEAAEAHDAQVLLLVTPTSPPNAYSALAREVYELLAARHRNVKLLDLSTPGAVPGLSYRTDFFDGGHVTQDGAAKTSAAIAAYLAKTYGLRDRRGEAAYASWDADAAARDRYVAALLRSLEPTATAGAAGSGSRGSATGGAGTSGSRGPAPGGAGSGVVPVLGRETSETP